MEFTARAKSQNGQFRAPAKFGHSLPRPNPTPGLILSGSYPRKSTHITHKVATSGNFVKLTFFLSVSGLTSMTLLIKLFTRIFP